MNKLSNKIVRVVTLLTSFYNYNSDIIGFGDIIKQHSPLTIYLLGCYDFRDVKTELTKCNVSLYIILLTRSVDIVDILTICGNGKMFLVR